MATSSGLAETGITAGAAKFHGHARCQSEVHFQDFSSRPWQFLRSRWIVETSLVPAGCLGEKHWWPTADRSHLLVHQKAQTSSETFPAQERVGWVDMKHIRYLFWPSVIIIWCPKKWLKRHHKGTSQITNWIYWSDLVLSWKTKCLLPSRASFPAFTVRGSHPSVSTNNFQYLLTNLLTVISAEHMLL